MASGTNCGPIIPIDLNLVVDDVDTEIAAGWDQIKIERSTNSEAGPWREITNSSTRIDLIAGQDNYEYTDPAGNGSYWYRYVLYNSGSDTDDTPSGAMQGEQDPALDILSIDELKSFYLFGVDLTDDAGNPYPDSMYAHYIKAAVDWLENDLLIQIKKQSYTEEMHDFYRDDYDNYIWLKLHNHPVISIEEVKLVLPGEQTVKVFEKEWIHIERHDGQLQLVPGTGTAGSILLGASGSWIPLIYGNNKFIPDCFRVSYTAGFGKPPAGSFGFTPGSNPPSVSRPDPKLEKVPPKIKEVIGKIAALGPFNIAGDLLGGAGIASQSISIDGLSTSFNTTSSATNAGYGARIIQYQKDLKQEIPRLRATYHGQSLTIV